MHSTRLSDALHILAYLHLAAGAGTSSADIARSVHTNPAYVRQLMSKLKAAGLITVTRGRSDAALAVPPDEITMCNVYQAVMGDAPVLHLDTHVNPECGIGVNVQLAISDFYARIQDAVYREMQTITLADILDRYEDLAANWTGTACPAAGTEA